MRILVNFLPVWRGGGAQNVLNLWRMVREAGCGHEWLAVARPELRLDDAGSEPWRLLRRVAVRSFGQRLWLENVWVPALAGRWGADVIFTPMGAGPLRGPVPAVIGWHDSYVAYPESPLWRRCTARFRVVAAVRARYARVAARRALRICVQTDIMARRLARVWGIEAERFRVIANGPSRFLEEGTLGPAPPGEGVGSAAAAGVEEWGGAGVASGRGAAGPQGPGSAGRGGGSAPVGPGRGSVRRILVVAEPQPAKNLEVVPAVAAALLQRGVRDAEFVLTVPERGGPYMKPVERALAQAETGVRVRRIGRVPHERLAALYRSGDAVFLPSLIESFSAAYVEAMQFGLPIVTSDLEFARDICGDAAVYAAPLDAPACAEALARVLADEVLRERLRDAGFARVRTFPDWRQRFAAYLGVLEEAVGRTS